MPLRSTAGYVASLKDGRRVYYNGKLIEDITVTEPFRTAIEHASTDYGGYQSALAIHAEGSIEDERLTILRDYDETSSCDLVNWMTAPSD